jgi:hypothetical protein
VRWVGEALWFPYGWADAHLQAGVAVLAVIVAEGTFPGLWATVPLWLGSIGLNYAGDVWAERPSGGAAFRPVTYGQWCKLVVWGVWLGTSLGGGAGHLGLGLYQFWQYSSNTPPRTPPRKDAASAFARAQVQAP